MLWQWWVIAFKQQQHTLLTFPKGAFQRQCSKNNPITIAAEASLNQMVSEIKSAVKYIYTRFPKSKLFVCGHLAGAHLCTMIMVSDWSKDPSIPQAIHGMFLLSGVFYLIPIVNNYVNDALKLTEESAAQISPHQILIKMLPTFMCPILVVMEEHGSPEFY